MSYPARAEGLGKYDESNDLWDGDERNDLWDIDESNDYPRATD